MKLLFTSVGFFLFGYLIFQLISCKNRSSMSNQPEAKQNVDTEKVRKTKVQENMYPELRNKALTITPDELHLKLDSSNSIVYGTVMDWDIGQAIVTVAAFQTGDASLYLSAGQIYIGGYAHENIRNAGLLFVKESQSYLSKAKATEQNTLPDKGCVRFYLLTNKGKFTFQETVENITSKSSDWTPLFDLANNVITEYRTITDNK
jgi:hypothetical protein